VDNRRVVMWRDASFWVSPDTIAPKKAHYPHHTERHQYGGPRALCNSQIMLNPDSECYEDEVRYSVCKRCQKVKV
jgi:hypothetical protein